MQAGVVNRELVAVLDKGTLSNTFADSGANFNVLCRLVWSIGSWWPS